MDPYDGSDMPTGIRKTEVERRADMLLAAIEKNARELHTLAYAGQEDTRRIQKLRVELNGAGHPPKG